MGRFDVGVVIVAFVAVASLSCGAVGGSRLFRQYEYEEEMYLALDGSATIYVNSSIPALNALRGTSFDERPSARVDTDAVRAFFNSPVTRVVRVSTSRRSNRRFVHVRIAVADIRQLPVAAPFAWSTYSLRPIGDLVEFKQTVGRSLPPPLAESPRAPADPSEARSAQAGSSAISSDAASLPDLPPSRVPRSGEPGRVRPTSGRPWTGDELVAFRIHIPSVITHHDNAAELRRGNILAWEQPLADRLRGVPLSLEVRMEPRSILYSTLFLFAGTIGAAGATFAFVIWRLMRRGREQRTANRTPNGEPRTEPRT